MAAAAEPLAAAPAASGTQADGQPAAGAGPPPAADGGGGFVFDEACRERLNSILAQYKGTHNFHNYTVKAHLPHFSEIDRLN